MSYKDTRCLLLPTALLYPVNGKPGRGVPVTFGVVFGHPSREAHIHDRYFSPNIRRNRPVAPMLLLYVLRLTVRLASRPGLARRHVRCC